MMQLNRSHRAIVRAVALCQALAIFMSPIHMVSLTASTSERVSVVDSPLLARTQHTMTVLQDGRVLIVGGRDETGPLASAALYNPSDRSVQATGPMNVKRVGHVATLLNDGRVLITGGDNDHGTLSSAETFDPASMAFQPVGSMIDARVGHAATKLSNGSVLISGGTSTGSVETFDPTGNSFATIPATMTTPRTGHSATLFSDDNVLLIGGGVASAELFNPGDSTFTLTLQPPTITRVGHDAIVSADHHLLVLGGGSPMVEQFDPVSQTFSVRATLSSDAMTGSLMANERILALGIGHPAIVSPADGQVETLAEIIPLQRSGHAAVELPLDKTILVTGGVNASNELVASAAVFNPAMIATDLDDYAPGATVYITGSGFLPNETVQLQVAHLGYIFDYDETHVQTELDEFNQGTNLWTVQADAHGNLTDVTWLVCEVDCLGALLELTADGLTSGLSTTTRFTDGNIKFTTTGLPSGVSVTVNVSYDQPGSSGVTSTTTTFNSPGPSATISAENNTVVTYSFPASISHGGNTYVLTSSSPASGSIVGSGSTIITGNYTANAAPICNAGGSYTSTCRTASITASASDPDQDSLTIAWTSSNPNVAISPSNSLSPTATLADGVHPCSSSATLTLTVSDGKGGSCTSTTTVTFSDTSAPTFNEALPADASVACDNVPDAATLTASDNCDAHVPVDFTETRTDGTCPNSYTLTRTWTATDDCGNTASNPAELKKGGRRRE